MAIDSSVERLSTTTTSQGSDERCDSSASNCAAIVEAALWHGNTTLTIELPPGSSPDPLVTVSTLLS
jgi:hypothetical protein